MKPASCVGHGKRLTLDRDPDITVFEYGPLMHSGDGNRPAGLSVGALNGVFRDSSETWAYEQSPCTTSDLSSAPRIGTDGGTDNEANINSSGYCVNPDGVSTVDSGDLPSGFVAAACRWPSATFHVREFDIRFNVSKSFTTAPTSRSAITSTM